MKETCERCRRYDGPTSTCRGLFPQIDFKTKPPRACWPTVESTDWCAQFEYAQAFNSGSLARSDQAIAETLARRREG